LHIGQWLRELGLQSYEQAFCDNGVDVDVLCRLTAEDLKEIGVSGRPPAEDKTTIAMHIAVALMKSGVIE
jgi:hypothetical protein